MALLGLTLLGGCNNHALVGVHYDSSQVCGESLDIPITRPRVVLVVDRSGSMSENPLGEGTRWEALHGVISEVVDGQDRTTDFGLAMFPATGAGDTFTDGACNSATALDVAVSSGAGDAIIAALPGPLESTHGGTPAASAVALAADHLRGLAGNDPKLMVLITDGAANCTADA
ncbi:MAG: VWA domain-containing protein, partial [Myxococcales bacterium]|nr:VWA domain-containing protein [Myxococcales bacterium]